MAAQQAMAARRLLPPSLLLLVKLWLVLALAGATRSKLAHSPADFPVEALVEVAGRPSFVVDEEHDTFLARDRVKIGMRVYVSSARLRLCPLRLGASLTGTRSRRPRAMTELAWWRS
jgi:hypothetical protein